MVLYQSHTQKSKRTSSYRRLNRKIGKSIQSKDLILLILMRNDHNKNKYK
jgi:hypothetical protein